MKAARLHAYGTPLVLEDGFEVQFETTLWGTLQELREVLALAEDGRLTLIETETAPLDQINDVYRRVKAGQVPASVGGSVSIHPTSNVFHAALERAPVAAWQVVQRSTEIAILVERPDPSLDRDASAPACPLN